MAALGKDIRFTLRKLARNRSVTILAVTALALGIGAATAVFSIIYNVLLRPFPYAEANRLVLFGIYDASGTDPRGRFNYSTAEFLDYSKHSRTFDAVVGTAYEYVVYDNGQGAQQVYGSYVTPNLFDVLDVQAFLGRAPGAEEARSGSTPVFVMGYKMWRRLGLDAEVIGRSFVLDGTPRVCIGVMPEHFAFWNSELWIPEAVHPGNPEVNRRKFYFIGRLKPGVSKAAAGVEMEAIARREAQIFPKEYPKQFVVRPQTLVERAVGDFRGLFALLSGAVVLLLLIACTNVANLLLAQATTRDKEMAIRASLGASRFRIVRQLMVESLVLCTAAAIFGCLLARVFLTRVAAIVPPRTIPEEAQIHLDLTVLMTGIAITVFTALLCGLAPALRVQRTRVSQSLNESVGTHTGRGQGRTRNILVVAEVAFCIVLLVVGGSLLRSFFTLRSVELGFDTHKLFGARVPLPTARYNATSKVNPFFQTLLQRLNNLPGVEAATHISSLPPYPGLGLVGEIEMPGKSDSERRLAMVELASADFFRTLGLPFLRGRGFTAAEVDSQQKVAVVNEAFRKKFFGTEDPIGRVVKVSQLQNLNDPVADPVFEILGVVPDFRNMGIEEPTLPGVFVPYTVTSSLHRGILVRTNQDPALLVEAVRKEIWAVDPLVMLGANGPLDTIIQQMSYAAPEFGSTLTSAFAIIGLALAVIGVYSVMNYTVAQQTRGIAVRMALGARQGTVLGMVLRTGLSLVLVGSALGAAMSVVVMRLVSTRLYEMPALDLVSFGAVLGVLFPVAFAACYLPARRAARVDPIISLRHQ